MAVFDLSRFFSGAIRFLLLAKNGIASYGKDLQNPDFAKMAGAATDGDDCGGAGADSTDDYEGFPARRPRAGRSSHGPRQELSMPPTITVEWIKALGLFMLKAVLSGRWP